MLYTIRIVRLADGRQTVLSSVDFPSRAKAARAVETMKGTRPVTRDRNGRIYTINAS